MKQRLSVFFPGPQPSVLYGAVAGPNTTSDLYLVDPTDASVTSVGPIGFAVTGLAFRPSDAVLFGITSGNSASNPRSLITVDTTTGAGTLVGALGVSIGDIAFKSNDVLYGINSANRRLQTINTSTGTATQVSATAIPGSGVGLGVSFNLADVLYGFTNLASGRFYIVDTTTGVGTQQSIMSGAPAPAASTGAASFDSTDVLYIVLVNQANPTYLATMNVADGVISPIGITQQNLDAIAWSIQPTPPAGPPVETVLHPHTWAALANSVNPRRRSRSKFKLRAPMVVNPFVPPAAVYTDTLVVSLSPYLRGPQIQRRPMAGLRSPRFVLSAPTAAFVARETVVVLARQRRGRGYVVLVRPIVVFGPQDALGWIAMWLVPRRLQPTTRSRLEPPAVLSSGEVFAPITVHLAWKGKRR